MTNPYEPSKKESVIHKSQMTRWFNREIICAVIAILLVVASPLVLLMAHLFVPRPFFPTGVRPSDTTIDYIVLKIQIGHLVFAVTAMAVVWLYSKNPAARVIITFAALVSIPATFLFGLGVMFAKGNKWL